jgi:hypothetical protein
VSAAGIADTTDSPAAAAILSQNKHFDAPRRFARGLLDPLHDP